MNDDERTILQQIAHLEAIASTMRDDLKAAYAGLMSNPDDEGLLQQVDTLQYLLKDVTQKVEKLRGQLSPRA